MGRADEWRVKAREMAFEEAEEVELPSGAVVTARRIGMPFFLGRIGVEESGNEIDTALYLRQLLDYCILAPRVSLEPTEEEIHPRDIPNGDLDFILSWAVGRAE